MKKIPFISTFIIAHVFFIFFQIHKHSTVIKLSYDKQKLEKERDTLITKKQDLTQALYAMKTPSAISSFAHKQLGMSKIKLKQIKKLQPHEQSV